MSAVKKQKGCSAYCVTEPCPARNGREPMEFPAVPATLPASLPTVALVGWWPSVVVDGSALGPRTSSELPVRLQWLQLLG